jgi:hypothetical protein
MLDRALAILQKAAAKHGLPILGTRRQPPPGPGQDAGASAGAAGRRWGGLATARLTLSVAADQGHPRARTRAHRHGAAVRFPALDGGAERPPFAVALPHD